MKYIILENVRSAHNVGAIFRTADGAGVAKVFLVGYTPLPIDRFGRVQSQIEKTALGANRIIPWEHQDSVALVIESLKRQGVLVVAVEQDEKSATLSNLPATGDVAYLFGNEVDGVSREALALSDLVVELPMCGEKESLNVATTAGIVLYYDLV